MQTTKWSVAPWMRRRIARHVERGTSQRVLSCLIGSAVTSASKDAAGASHHEDTLERDLTNVIPFRVPQDPHSDALGRSTPRRSDRVSESG